MDDVLDDDSRKLDFPTRLSNPVAQLEILSQKVDKRLKGANRLQSFTPKSQGGAKAKTHAFESPSHQHRGGKIHNGQRLQGH